MNDVDLNFRLSSTNFDDENARHPCHSVCLALPLIGHFPKLKPAQMKNTWNESVVRMHATDVVSSPIFWLAVSPAWNASTRALVCCWWLCLLFYIENQAQHFPLFIYTTITTQTKTELYNIDCGGFSGKSVFQTMKRVCFTCVSVWAGERTSVWAFAWLSQWYHLSQYWWHLMVLLTFFPFPSGTQHDMSEMEFCTDEKRLLAWIRETVYTRWAPIYIETSFQIPSISLTLL